METCKEIVEIERSHQSIWWWWRKTAQESWCKNTSYKPLVYSHNRFCKKKEVKKEANLVLWRIAHITQKKILNNETETRPDLIYSCKNWGLGNNNFIHRKQKVKLGSIFPHFQFLVYLFICYRFTPLKYGNNDYNKIINNHDNDCDKIN